MPSASSCVDIGGYTSWSEPVTSWPLLAQEARRARPWRCRRWPTGGSSCDAGASSTAKRRLAAVHTSRARTPRGSVTFGWAVWPLERPRATGTSSPAERLEHDLLERVVLVRARGAALHVPEDDPASPPERARGAAAAAASGRSGTASRPRPRRTGSWARRTRRAPRACPPPRPGARGSRRAGRPRPCPPRSGDEVVRAARRTARPRR